MFLFAAKAPFPVSSAAGGFSGSSLNFPAVTGGTFSGFFRFPLVSPGMPTAFAAETPVFHHHIASLDVKYLSENEAFRYFLSGSVEDIAEGLSGNLHVFRRMLLIKSLQIRKANGLKLVEPENHRVFLQYFHIFPFREKGYGRGKIADNSVFFRSWHEIFAAPPFLRFLP